MYQTSEKDPHLRAVIDTASQRNLLDPKNPTPLEVNFANGKAARIGLVIQNSDAGLIDLAISSDEKWVEPERSRLTLPKGASGECHFTAKPDGDSEFANLLFSWEGTSQTLCQSVMVQRKSKSPSGSTKPDDGDKPIAIEKLVKFIKGCAPDKFIDYDEEQQIFRKGGELGFDPSETESILNRLCGEGGWTRQTRLTDKLTAMLHEATEDDGVIDEQEYEHILNFAIKRAMPRRDADEHCITLILDNAWKAKKAWWRKLLGLPGWFEKKRSDFCL
jgi:hypothetical protein